MKKKGFTLSETLVALAIMGVLAATLLPTIQKSLPNKNRVMMKKAFNTVSQSISNLTNDTTVYPDGVQALDNNGASVERILNNTCRTYTTGTGCASFYPNNKFAYLLSEQLNIIGTLYEPAPTFHSFTTSDGVFWNMYDILFTNDNCNKNIIETTNASGNTYQFPLNLATYPLRIVVDVNGLSNGPNCSTDNNFNTLWMWTNAASYKKCTVRTDCSNNPDTFIVSVRYDGKIWAGASPQNDTDACLKDILSTPTQNN